MDSKSGSDRKQWIWAAIFALALSLAYAWMDDFSLVRMGLYQLERPDVGRPLFNALAFTGTYILCLGSLFLLQVHASRLVRFSTYGLILATVGVFYGFSSVSTRGFTVTEATIVRVEAAYWSEAVRFHFADYAPMLGAVCLGIAMIELLVLPRLPRPRTLWVGLAPLIAGACCYQLLLVTDAKVDRFPIPFRVTILTAYVYNHESVDVGRRDEPTLSPTSDPLADHIVLLLDESIRGDMLSLNGGSLPTTPYLESIQERLFNYGVASAIANLSAPANIILQSGLKPEELPDLDMRSMKNPNLFAHTARAGFYNVLINAQNALSRPPNFMTDRDVEALDEYLQIREIEPGLMNHEPDSRIPGILHRIIAQNQRSFSYVIKDGAHFPYTNRFPEEERVFRAEQFMDAHDAATAETVAEYVNTIRYSTDHFMQVLVPILEATGKNVLVIYTSDHGQSLFEEKDERGKKIRGHGHHVDPPIEQAIIPLFLLPFGETTRLALARRYAPELIDRVSAYELFSTFLVMAGYDEDEVAGRYGHSIFDRNADREDRTFVSGNHFGVDGPLYRDSPYRSSFSVNPFSWPRKRTTSTP